MRSNSASDANLDVAAASARLRQSRAERRVAGAAELPTLAAAGSYDRERGSENGILSLLGVTPSAAPTQSASGGTPFGVAAAPARRRLITSTRPASMRRGNSTSGGACGAASKQPMR